MKSQNFLSRNRQKNRLLLFVTQVDESRMSQFFNESRDLPEVLSKSALLRSRVDVQNHQIFHFTITAEILARSLANFYRQYADRHMNLKFVRRTSKRERAIRPFVIVKKQIDVSFLMSLSCY